MNDALYDGAKGALRLLFGSVWRMRVYGAQNVPANGGLIVACNHISYLDPPLLGAACPRRIQYMAKQELFDIPVLGRAIRAVGAYPVDRKGSAKAAIRRSVDVLQQGGTIGIFPEGTRNLDGNAPVHSGVALLASIAGVPVVPACVVGTAQAKRLASFSVRFGKPVQLPHDRKAAREEIEAFTNAVMQQIRSLMEMAT